MPRKRRKKRNKGWFKKGKDARRSSYRFTPSDCRVGWLVANSLYPHLRDYLKMKLRVYYHQKAKENHGEETHGNGDCPF